MENYYSLLGVARTASFEEIKASFKRLAATHRPPELSPGALRQQRISGRASGSRVETSSEQKQAWLKIQQAYDTLANPRRREPYDRRLGALDTHAADTNSSDLCPAASSMANEDVAPDFSQLDAPCFFAAVNEYFESVSASEPPRSAHAPDFGCPESSWEAVRAFYDHWLTWNSGKDFRSAERHGSEEVAAASCRQVRRLMEAEDEKLRRQARKAYSQQVREAAQQAHGCDPRVQARRESQRRDAALEAARVAEEQEAESERLEQERVVQRLAARAADEARWAAQSPELFLHSSPESFNASCAPFFCAACNKGFRTKDAWLGHAASKRHRHNARRWEEAGKGSALIQSGSHPASPLDAVSYDDGWQGMRSPLLLPEPAIPVPESEFGPLSDACPSAADVFRVCNPSIAETSPSQRCRESPNLRSSAPGLRPCKTTTCDVNRNASTSPLLLHTIPVMLELVAAVPSHNWVQILSFLDVVKECIRAVVALLSCSLLRDCTLSASNFWDELALMCWGPAHIDSESWVPLGDGKRFLEVASSIDEASNVFAFLNADLDDDDPPGVLGRIPMGGFTVQMLKSACGIIAAGSHHSTEIRLFDNQLGRLPPVRTRGKPLRALALTPNAGHVAAGTCDGLVNLYSLDDPDEAPTRLHRSAPPSSDHGRFAGLDFFSSGRLVVASGGASPDVAVVDIEAGAPVAESFKLGTAEPGCGVLAVMPLETTGSDVAVLQNQSGKVLIWDVRTPDPAPILDFANNGLNEGAPLLAATVDPCKWLVVAASPGVVYWGDLRTQRTGALQLPVCHNDDPPFLTLGSRGGLFSAWHDVTEVMTCTLAGIPRRPLLGHADRLLRVPIAACGPISSAGCGAELVLSVTIPTKSGWNNELCAFGSRGCTSLHRLSAASAKRPQEKVKKASAPAQIRRVGGRHGVQASRRRGSR